MFDDLSLLLTSENIGSAGVIFFAFICIVPVVKQTLRIVKLRSGQSVSATWVAYLACMQSVLLIYGIDIDSIPIMINGAVTVAIQISLLLVLWRFKEFSGSEKKQLILFTLIVITFWFFPSKTFFVVVALGSIISTALLTKELYQEKDPGVLDIWLLCIYLASNIFWNVYGFSIMDWAIIALSIPLFFIFVSTIVLWYYYRHKK